jgi:type II secretory pathway component PulC
MSLVHEALQKAEREKQRKTGVAPVATHNAPPTGTPKAAPPEPLAAVAIRTTPTVKEIAPAKPVAAAPAVPPQKSQYALLSVLIACVAAVAIVAIVYLVSHTAYTIRESREAVAATKTTATPPAPKPAEANKLAPTPAPPVNQTLATSQPDAQPPPSAEVSAPDTSRFKLTGIMKDPGGDKFIAVLNGHMVSEGYSVEGATVKQIERDRVTLDIAGRETVLRLF